MNKILTHYIEKNVVSVFWILNKLWIIVEKGVLTNYIFVMNRLWFSSVTVKIFNVTVLCQETTYRGRRRNVLKLKFDFQSI